MGRSGKDLFVILAERQNRHSGNSTASQPRQRKSDDGSGDGVARTLGRWVQSAVRTVRGTEEESPTRRRRPTRSRGPQQVPRGLLLPGWMLAAMIVVALGGGFALGRFTSGVGAGDELDVKRNPVTPRKFAAAEPGALAPADEESMLDTFFYVVQTHPPDDRNGAARLAQYIRGVGIARTRIHAFRDKKGSIVWWTTLCFVASSTNRDPKTGKLLPSGADAKRVLEQLDRVSVPEFDAGTCKTDKGYPAHKRGVVSLSPSM